MRMALFRFIFELEFRSRRMVPWKINYANFLNIIAYRVLFYNFFKCFTSFESWNFWCRNYKFSTCLRVASFTFCTFANVEATESDDLNFFIFSEESFDCIKCSIYCISWVFFWKTSCFYDFSDQILFVCHVIVYFSTLKSSLSVINVVISRFFSTLCVYYNTSFFNVK